MEDNGNIRNQLSEKFKDYEAQPQDNTWEKIRLGLDLKNKFSSYEAEPQDETWDKIRLGLDLKNKFSTYEPEPQDETWSKIRLGLDLKDKFSSYEAEPQDETWNKIRLGLDLKDKFSNYEAEPQDESWEKIRFDLDLKDKFSNYEAEPQDETWSKIQLATNLSEKFRNYEAEPQAKSWKIIEAAIKKDKRRRLVILPIFYRAGIAASIALLLGFGWLLSRNQSNDATNNVAINKKTAANKNGTASNSNKQSDKSTQTGITKDNISTEKTIDKPNTQPEIKPSTESNIEQNLASNSKTRLEKRKVIPDKIRLNDGKLKEASENENLAQHKPKSRAEKEKNRLPIDLETNKTNEENIIAANKETNNPQTESNDNTLTLSALNSKSFKQGLIRKPFGEIAYNNERPMMLEEERVRRKMILTTSLMPLQTYQALTILPQTNSYIQQVGTLNALDAQRLGVQARVGAIMPLSNRFSVSASATYSGVPQRISYEVNNGDYEIQTTDSQTYTLVGVNESVSQNKFLQTVGLKIDNSYLLAKKRNEIYVSGGGEAVRVINENQYAYYLNASIGVSYPTKSGKTVWIEPTFRYSLSQSLDANSYLQIRPYNVGLNVRVNFM